MPLASFEPSELERSFEIMDIPRHGKALVIPPVLARVWEPTWMEGDFTTLINQVLIRIDSLYPETVSLVKEYVVEWIPISTSPMRLSNTPVAGGTVVDHYEQRELIRQRVARALQIVVPAGGFYEEMLRKIDTGSMANCGDR